MGCNDDTRTFEAPNEAAALKRAKALMEEACHEQGHDGYSGHIGICDGIRVHRTAKPMSVKEAEAATFGRFDAKTGEQISEGLARKWGPAILVRIRNKGSRKAKWVLAGMCAS